MVAEPFYILTSNMRFHFLYICCQHLLLSIFLILAILEGMKWWSLLVVLICISLLINDVEHPFTCLWVICMNIFITEYLGSF